MAAIENGLGKKLLFKIVLVIFPIWIALYFLLKPLLLRIAEQLQIANHSTIISMLIGLLCFVLAGLIIGKDFKALSKAREEK